jgi:acyl-CoA thioesterase
MQILLQQTTGSIMTDITPQQRAEKCAAIMLQNDRASRHLGIELVNIAPGSATMHMTVTNNHLNGHNICHGGFIFTLADSTFAFACNSYNMSTVAQQNSISFLAPGLPDETLLATATETSKIGRNGIYDVTVTGKDGRVVAEFRGCSRTIKGQHFDEDKG